MKRWKKWQIWSIFLLVLISMNGQVFAERIKDIAQVAGVRSNQLIGYGLVVGLNGSGDKNPFTDQSLTSMLNKFGINMPDGVKPNSKNIAAVSVTATLPPFMKPGQTIDISVSSLGNAKSLAGGVLLLTPLKGLDGKIYAMAQGSLIVSGNSVSGKDGSNVTTNFPAGGHIPNGAIVEQAVDMGFDVGSSITLNLRNGDFTTVTRMVNAINKKMGEDTARALDAHSVEVLAPRMAHQKVSFLAEIENIELTTATPAAKVIVNSRTGTVVAGQEVRIKPAAVSHGKLTISIKENPLAAGRIRPGIPQADQVVNDSDVNISEKSAPMFVLNSPTVYDVVQQVNSVGAAPSDLVAILEALKSVGALDAELLVI